MWRSRSVVVGSAATLAVAGVLLVRRRLNWFKSVEWWKLSGVQAVEALQGGAVTPMEMLESAIGRLEAVDPAINAVVTRCFERARTRARELSQRPGGPPGPLYGLPVLVKDNQPVAGEVWTAGSACYAGRVAEISHPIVEQIEASGGIVYGITNMPDFGLGSHTFNTLHGPTSNPHDLSRSAGGSSGGAAAALASGAGWLALGNDHGGSLRQPAGFCGIVGLRPSPGRCAMAALPPSAWNGWWSIGVFSTEGPLGRSVADVALCLDAIAPAHVELPAKNWVADCIPDLPPPPPGGYLACVRDAAQSPPVHVAWSANLGGLLKGVHPEVAAAVQKAARLLAEHCAPEALLQQAAPRDLGRAAHVSQVLRANRTLHTICGGPGEVAREWMEQNESLVARDKPEALYELRNAQADEWKNAVAQAEHERQEIESSFVRFFSHFEYARTRSTRRNL